MSIDRIHGKNPIVHRGAAAKEVHPEKDIFRKSVSYAREILYTRLGLAVTLVATVGASWNVAGTLVKGYRGGQWALALEQSVFLIVMLLLIYGNVLYQLTRISYMKRLSRHRSETRSELNSMLDGMPPSLTFLIPSYKEERRVILQALYSTSLQEYAGKRVVLLIDDPVNPRSKADREALESSVRLPSEVQAVLAEPARQTQAFLRDFQDRLAAGPLDRLMECFHLSDAYAWVSGWYRKQANLFDPTDHADRLFIKEAFEKPSERYAKLADDLFSRALKDDSSFNEREFLLEYRRMAGTFQGEISSFQRKKYENLSHMPNKAMNLNSYIGLMGRTYRETVRKGKTYLEPAREADLGAVHFRASEFLVTLDADSFLSSDYALRLMRFMCLPGNERVAVVQTPYSAIPGAPTEIEKIAGATTDIQYLIHQGFTGHGATFWVGANALLRFSALRDIEQRETERGHVVSKFIQDRTVIEDTESSIDLVVRKWTLHNYPERLSYSATPPDFGSLLIQRARWANGGLIILPKLLSYLFSRPFTFAKLREGFMRVHYLFSIAAVNLGVVILLAYPFEANLMDFWLPLTAVPYYFFYGRDLIQAGYRLSDLFKVYAMNLLLIPINLPGVYKSVQQMVTGETIPFKRTPKVMGRTTAPAGFVLAELAMLAYCGVAVMADAMAQRWLHAGFALLNAGFLYYAVQTFIGFGHSGRDLHDSIRSTWQGSGKKCVKPAKDCACVSCSPAAAAQ